MPKDLLLIVRINAIHKKPSGKREKKIKNIVKYNECLETAIAVTY